jgi:hypothetical protein
MSLFSKSGFGDSRFPFSTSGSSAFRFPSSTAEPSVPSVDDLLSSISSAPSGTTADDSPHCKPFTPLWDPKKAVKVGAVLGGVASLPKGAKNRVDQDNPKEPAKSAFKGAATGAAVAFAAAKLQNKNAAEENLTKANDFTNLPKVQEAIDRCNNNCGDERDQAIKKEADEKLDEAKKQRDNSGFFSFLPSCCIS